MNSITFLGTGNAMCTRCYNTCFYLRSQSGAMLVDAGGGNGIFRQLYKAHIPYEEIRHIFVTHVHTDHILGVVWLIRKISPLIHKGKHPGKLMIYCNSEVRPHHHLPTAHSPKNSACHRRKHHFEGNHRRRGNHGRRHENDLLRPGFGKGFAIWI